MKVLYLDLETTGLYHSIDQIIEIGMVYDDLNNPKPISELPKFHTYIKHDRVWYLDMHKNYYLNILPTLNENHEPEKVIELLHQWLLQFIPHPNLKETTKVTVGGKNVAAFDFNFLASQFFEFKKEGSNLLFHNYKFGTRVVDPGMLYFDPKIDLRDLPNTNECAKRAGLEQETRHDAIGDCILILKAVRKYYKLPVEMYPQKTQI